MRDVASPRYKLTVLGRFELSGPDGPVELPNKKLAGLLAHLACTAPVPQQREKLATLLWGSHFDTQARQNLRQALFRLRQALGHDLLIGDGDGISLAPGVIDCDATRFQGLIREGTRASLAEAVDLYKEGLLSDVNISEEAWTHWLTGERQRLEDLALDGLVKYGEIELAVGHPHRGLETAHRALAINNLREDAHRLVIQGLAAAGRKAEALKHYQKLVTLLKRELNAKPDAATDVLVAELGNARQPSSARPVGHISEPALPGPDRASHAMSALAGTHDVSTERPLVTGDQALPAGVIGFGRPERRQLTIMVCNKVSSMPLSAGRDPEEMRERVSAFHKAVADVVIRFDGFIAQYLSDGMVVYFGYPLAHEDDAEQAVRAAIAILDALRSLKTSSSVPLRARVGIATGLVVVDEPQGSGDTRQRVAIGETPNLAAQLQAVAAPGEIVIAASTQRLVGSMFDCRALAADACNELPQSPEAWQVRGETTGVSRFEAQRRGALTPFVGRQEEMDLLLRRWEQAKAREGRVVLLSGEAGIGKSRISESLLARIEGEPHARLRYFCSPHHTHSPLHPVIAQLEQAARFEPNSGVGAKLDKLMSLLEATSKNLSRDVALVAELLAIPMDERYPAMAVSPQTREMTLMALLEQLDGAAAQTPVLIVFEDVHWIDPTSLDLLDRTVAVIANLRVLLVVTFRPDFQPTWVGLPHVTTLPLSRLSRRDSTSIIGGITGGKALPDAVIEQILSHSDGVALFLEELTRMLLENGPLRETAESYELDGALPPLAVPTTLQASLVARLDRLGSGKAVALVGAAIGREFSHELIAATSDMVPSDLDAALERLTASGLMSRRGTPPQAIYTFKHALVQDAAYATMLKSQRRELHASIAKVLVEQFPALAQSQPEVVAQHFGEAGFVSEAIDYWRKAAQLASARSAMREAVGSFERALALLESLPETRERQEQAIDLRCDLCNAAFALGTFELRFLRAAASLAEALDDRRRLGQVCTYLCRNAFMAGRLREAREFGERALVLAKSINNVPLDVMASLYFGAVCFHLGDYARAEDLLLKVLQSLDGDRRRERFGLAGFPAVIALGFLAWLLADRGRFEEAMSYGEEGLRLADSLGHPYSQVFALWMLGRAHVIRGDLSNAVRLHQRGLAISREWKLTLYSLHHMGSLGYAHSLSGRVADGMPLLQDAQSAMEGMEYGLAELMLLEDIGETYLAADRFADALDIAERVLDLTRERDQVNCEAWALRLVGEAASRRNPAQHADDRLDNALALAEELGMRPLVARCHLALGKRARSLRQQRAAQDHLTAAATMCREMGMRFWLEQAEAELGQDDLRI
ncbi:MAG: AAA family ATPase [Xanthobacteraceae bacterium]|nr:AAA family ATPase [Xanthobacteraceae bacterium]